MQRLIEFTTDADSVQEIEAAVTSAFSALGEARPEGVKLAYWKVPETHRFVAVIELEDAQHNPLLEIDAAAALTRVIGERVEGGYPVPQAVELIGSYGFEL